MSWSIHLSGRPRAVAAKMRDDVANQPTCNEPEEGIRKSIVGIVEAALSAMPEDLPVKVTAAGSQWRPAPDPEGTSINSVDLKIEPIYNFVE